jgi:hypothetical protein
VSVTTLSEVFLRIGQDAALNRQESEKMIMDLSRQRTEKAAALRPPHTGPVQAPSGNLFGRHLEALLWKRWHSTKRDRKVMLWQFVSKRASRAGAPCVITV